MALTVGTNSWATVAEADTYFLTRWGASAWAAFTTANKEAQLITAFNWIQSQPGLSISAASTAAVVKKAQYEAAWYIYKYWTSHEKRRAIYAQGVRQFGISKFGETIEKTQFPPWIIEMLSDYTTETGGTFPTVDRDLSNNYGL